jgi:hypothetical protein
MGNMRPIGHALLSGLLESGQARAWPLGVDRARRKDRAAISQPAKQDDERFSN